MRVRFEAHGRVQGVGFRYFTQERAQHLGLAGWVRNTWERSVEGEAEGDATSLEAFRQALEQGPSMARVSRLDWNPLPGGQSLPFPFVIRS